MKLTVASTIGKTTNVEVSDAIFAAKVSPTLIAQAVRVYLSNQRQGSAKTKTRSEINRTKMKWFKQKGTGNARHGARTPSLFVGGGVAHGPTGLQNHSLTMSATMRRQALAGALTAQVAQIVVSEDLPQLNGKTAPAAKMLAKMFPAAQHILVILNTLDDRVIHSLRNLDRVLLTTAAQLNTYQVVYADAIVMTKDAVKSLEARFSSEDKVEKTAKAEVKAEKVVVAPVSPSADEKAKPAATKATVKKAEPKTVKAPKSAKKATK